MVSSHIIAITSLCPSGITGHGTHRVLAVTSSNHLRYQLENISRVNRVGSGTKSGGGGDYGSSGPGPTTPGDPISGKPSKVLDIVVYVTVESSESDMTVSENSK
ncbi:hypothetical protein Tco_1202235 [Tanacetum coccineum]